MYTIYSLVLRDVLNVNRYYQPTYFVDGRRYLMDTTLGVENVCVSTPRRYATDPIYREKHKESHKKAWAKLKINRPIHHFARSTMNNHRRDFGSNIIFTLTELEEFVSRFDRCYWCGVLFDNTVWNRRSLDNINNNKDLRLKPEPNIAIICYSCNSWKRDLGLDGFKEKVKRIYDTVLSSSNGVS